MRALRNPFRPMGTLLARLALVGAFCTPMTTWGEELPQGYWSLQQSQEILDRTMILRLAPDLATLTEPEKLALEKLIQVGTIFQQLYEESLHHQAREAYEALETLDETRGGSLETQNLLKLYRLFKGPIATTLDNKRVPFLPVDDVVPGKNVYPWGVSKAELDEYLRLHPEQHEELLHVRTIVRRAEPNLLRLDLATMLRHPALETLHFGLREELREVLAAGDPHAYYAVPYGVAHADELLQAYALLNQAATLLEASDADFAQYLRQRARDLLSNDYEAGDAAWVSGRFGKLNAQIGSYEPYDDGLYALKAFHSTSLLLRDEEQSNALRSAIQGIQEFEDSLPYQPHRRVREDISVGVYNVMADFGQARSTNTATILPNEPSITRKYGRTILMRYNILTNSELFASVQQIWQAAIDPAARGDLKLEGNFHRTLWHEIGHYLGPDMTRAGLPIDQALEEDSSILEELKADLISLFLAKTLHERDYYDDLQLRSVYASGIRRVLLNNRPRRDQTYATMQLMQMNYFLENNLLTFDAASQKLRIDYARYHEVVAALLAQVLEQQQNGDKSAADGFIDRYTSWKPDLHEIVAEAIRRTQTYRYRLIYYAALDE